MTEVENHIKTWIKETSKIRPELGNLSICPYSSSAKYTIIETSIKNIKPYYNYDIVFFVVENDLTLDHIQFWVDHYNKILQKWIFFEDCPDNKTFIKGIPTSNGKYNIITMQDREKLKQSREFLINSGYYHHWNDELLREILGNDYKNVKKGIETP